MSEDIKRLRDSTIDKTGKISSAIEQWSERTIGKPHFHIDEIFFMVLGFTIAVFAVVRCFFGIEITDEAYYVADAYGVLQGNLPFAYNTSVAAGMSLITFPFMWLFHFFSPDNEGVFLYMRLCYTGFRMLIILLMYLVLKKRFSRRTLLPACVMLIAWSSIIPNFSYNTSSFWLMLLSCTIVSVEYKEAKNKKLLFAAGMLAALAVFSHPLQIGTVVLTCILLALLSQNEKKVANILSYVMGGILQVVFVLGSIMAQTGAYRLITGIDLMLFHRLKSAVRVCIVLRWAYFFYWLIPVYIILVCLFILAVKFCSALNKFLELRWSQQYIWMLSVIFSLIGATVCYGRGGADTVLNYFGAFSFWIIVMLLVKIRDTMTMFVGAPFVIFFVSEVIFPSYSGGSTRAYFMYPVLFVSVILLLEKSLAQVSRKTLLILTEVFALLTAVLVIRCEYMYVYRDDPISELNSRVTEGIYKGIYTTEKRTECTVEMEHYVRENTGKEELVSFRDNAPFGYLMSNGIICDVRSWDAMQYAYVAKDQAEDNPAMEFRYYKNADKIPDKYIYIGLEQNEMLSCEDETFKFNEWLNAYYDKVDDVRINELYSAKIYEYNGEFDGDYDAWIDCH